MLIILPKCLLILAFYSEILVCAFGKTALKTNPVETSSILAPSGLEKDVDDPADNVIHDPRELGIPSKSRLKRSSSDDIDNFSDDGDVVYELSDIGHEFYTGQGDGDVNKDNTNFAFVEEDIDINSGYSSWGPWSVCSRTCGIGHKRRERKCTGQQHCTGGDVEETICALKKC